MDLVGALGQQLNLDEGSATGLAGGLLLLVEELVKERVNYGVAAQLREAVPELRDWQTSAPTIAPGMLSLDNLPPLATPGDEGEVAAVLSRFGVDGSRVPTAAMLLEQFLARRLDTPTLDAISAAIPLLG